MSDINFYNYFYKCLCNDTLIRLYLKSSQLDDYLTIVTIMITMNRLVILFVGLLSCLSSPASF